MTTRERYNIVAERISGLIAAGAVMPGSPVTVEAIAAAESELGYALTPSFKWFLLEFGAATFPAPPMQSSGDSSGPAQVLAPGATGRADLLAAWRELQDSKNHEHPLPRNLYPCTVTEFRHKRERIDIYKYLNSEWVDDEGEHIIAYFLVKTGRRGTTTFLGWLENVTAPPVEAPRPAPYEETAIRLRSDICQDRVEYETPASLNVISRTEQALEFRFPDAYRSFIHEFGAAYFGPFSLMPLEADTERNLLSVAKELRRKRPRIPERLVPFAIGVAWFKGGRFEPLYVCFDRERSSEGEPLLTEWVPKEKEPKRLKTTKQTFLGWLEERSKTPEKHLRAPRNWKNEAAWDRYWTLVIADDFWRNSEAVDLTFGLRDRAAWMR